jgi:hypothetical protein
MTMSIMASMKKYSGFSSERYLRYFAFHFFMHQIQKGRVVEFEMLDNTGEIRKFKLASELGTRYLPRLPVPIEGIRDSANVSWKMLEDNIGYICVRRIRPDLEAALDKAVSELKNARGLIVDVRGNTCARLTRSTPVNCRRKKHQMNLAPKSPLHRDRTSFLCCSRRKGAIKASEKGVFCLTGRDLCYMQSRRCRPFDSAEDNISDAAPVDPGGSVMTC